MVRSLTAAVLALALVAVVSPVANARATNCSYDNNGRSICSSAPAEHVARSARHKATRLARRHPADNPTPGLITVPTAAGIDITVAPDFAPKITAFIADLVATTGYKPRRIHCYASGGHVRGSLHYSGHACDFDQSGWGKTARAMYRVAGLVAKYGLRDGGEFRDWGHIDNGPHLHGRLARASWPRVIQ